MTVPLEMAGGEGGMVMAVTAGAVIAAALVVVTVGVAVTAAVGKTNVFWVPLEPENPQQEWVQLSLFEWRGA